MNRINPVKFLTNEELIYEMNTEEKKTRGTLIEIHISDLHLGALVPKYQYNILKEQFIYRIKDIQFDILSINGDIFDHKFMSSSDVIMYAIMLIDEIVQLCREKNATLVIIGGTAYHDANQLKLFYHYLEDPTIDIRIVEQVRFEYIKGSKILCIPEMYGQPKEYYEQFLYQTYDSVFMHGELKGAIYDRGKQSSEIESTKAPIFTIEDFCCCKGFIVSGHVHTPGCFNKNFYYSGSPYRWSYGESEDKGFLIVLHNLDTQEHYVHQEVIKSFRYDTINLDEMLIKDPHEVIDYINNLKDTNDIEYLRVEFLKENTELEVANLEVLRKYFYNNGKVKLKIENHNNQKILDTTNELLEKYKEYDYILDKSLSEYEILSMYINSVKGFKYITADQLIEIINEEI